MFQSLRSAFQKKAVGASTPAALPIFGITPTITGQNVTSENAMRVPAVKCAVSLISETTGGLPVKLHDRETREVEKDHPAYKLIHDEANPWTSAQVLREELTTDALLRGHGFALVIRNSLGEPLELHRLDPGAVQVETDDFTGEPTYHVQLKDGRHSYQFTDILHIKAFGGVAPITLGREAIGLSLAFEAHIAKLFGNGASPGGIITAPKTMSDEAKKNLKASWLDSHSGPKAGGVALLDEGMAYQQIAMTLTDAQFAENRLEQIREIARVFGVPPTMLFELTRGTWSNTEEMARQFLQVTLKPWLSEWTWAYARCLLAPEERRELYIEFNTNDLTTTDTAARATAYGQYRSMGAMTANEVRGGLNLPPRPDGEALENPYISTGATTRPATAESIPND
ncbi:phage portal protein [Mangrovicoccus ximenensis]|uniref:phage portal protein n=1 Tax=Mangrovicoccus ximenensis TaxID=1911570 RepID=UPI000D3C74CE|nr:phage portal protein [Mangrovicoccus ximenensis]